jgi:hypothetical protein
MINKSFGRNNKQNGLQLKYFYSTGNLTKEAESDIEEKMDKILFAAAEKAFNAIVDHLSKSPSKLLYWILAVAALALVGQTKKLSWKMVHKGWSFAKSLCGCCGRRGRSRQNIPQNPQADGVELVRAIPPDLPPHNDRPGQLANVDPQPAPIVVIIDLD